MTRLAVTNTTFWLPWPPSVNTYWRNVTIGGRARTILSKKGRDYQRTTRTIPPLVYLSGRLCVSIIARPPDRRARDLDNILKAILDCMAKAGLYDNDCQFDEIRIVRGTTIPGGSVYVRLSSVGDFT